MKSDIITGAMAEFAVYNYLKSKGIEVTAPDLSIHSEREKSYAADLHSNVGDFHVKSQTAESANRYGLSWLFQDSDRLLTLPSERAYLVFCMVDGDEVEIKAIVHNIDIVESDVVSRPKIGKYAVTKKAIYHKDLINSDLNIWSIK